MKYDVFISCKSNKYGLAEKVYDFLTANGFNVFFAKNILKKIGSADYGDAIDEALDQSTHLIVFCTSASEVEKETSPYVHYEWSSFNNEQRSGRKSGNIITILKNLNIAELPYGLRKFQSFPYDNFEDSLLSYVETEEHKSKANMEVSSEKEQSASSKVTDTEDAHAEKDNSTNVSSGNYGIRPEFMQLIVSIVETYYMGKNRKRSNFDKQQDIEQGIEQLIEIDSNSLSLEEDDLKTYCINILNANIKEKKHYKKEFKTEAYKILYTGEIKNVSDLSNYELYRPESSTKGYQNFNLLEVVEKIASFGSIVPRSNINRPVYCPKCKGEMTKISQQLPLFNNVMKDNSSENVVVKCTNPNCDCYVVTDVPHKAKQTRKYFRYKECCEGQSRLRHAKLEDVFFQCNRCGRKAHPTLLEYANHDYRKSYANPL